MRLSWRGDREVGPRGQCDCLPQCLRNTTAVRYWAEALCPPRLWKCSTLAHLCHIISRAGTGQSQKLGTILVFQWVEEIQVFKSSSTASFFVLKLERHNKGSEKSYHYQKCVTFGINSTSIFSGKHFFCVII